MLNQWMDEIVKLYDEFYDDKYTQDQLFYHVQKVMIKYKDEFKKYDESITKDMEDYQNREPINE